jgi:8-oxo-dGTP diphosphatase
MTRENQTPGQTEEQAFLAAYDAARFPHPSVAVDVALVTASEGELRAVLLQRAEHPDLGKWSLPGGFVRMEESLDEAAARVLRTKAGIEGIFLEQLYTFGRPDRDPRTRVISVAYYALTSAARLVPVSPSAASGSTNLATLHVPWEGERGGRVEVRDGAGRRLPLAYYAPIGFELLPRQFTLRDLQAIHETILGRRLNKDSFRRRMMATGLIEATGRLEEDVGHRPAELYRFRRQHGRRKGE